MIQKVKDWVITVGNYLFIIFIRNFNELWRTSYRFADEILEQWEGSNSKDRAGNLLSVISDLDTFCPYRKRYKKSLALKFDLLKLLERETAEYFLLHPSIRSIG